MKSKKRNQRRDGGSSGAKRSRAMVKRQKYIIEQSEIQREQHKRKYLQLNDAIMSWWGLQNVGMWEFDDEKRQKNIGYAENTTDSMDCFNTEDENECELKQPLCRWSRGCLPSQYKSSFPEIGAKINSKFDGTLFTLTFFIEIEMNVFEKIVKIISVFETQDKAVIVFPTGGIINDMEEIIPEKDQKRLLTKIRELIKKKKMVILCGHSMGCVLAQMFGVKLMDIIKEKDNFVLYIVGSGAYKWTSQANIDIFEKVYINRCKFFGSKLFDEDEDEVFADSFLLEGEGDIFETTLLDDEDARKPSILNDKTIEEYIFDDDGIHDWDVYYNKQIKEYMMYNRTITDEIKAYYIYTNLY